MHDDDDDDGREKNVGGSRDKELMTYNTIDFLQIDLWNRAMCTQQGHALYKMRLMH